MKIRDFGLEQYFGRYEFNAPYLLCQSDCESLSIAELLALEPESRDAYLNTRLGYSENDGAMALRQTISSLYETIPAKGVICHTGAQEAVFSYMNMELNPGDHVIAMFPAYQSLYEVARAAGCQVSLWTARHQTGGWYWDFDELEGLIRPETKLLVINTPHNPTGYAFSGAELKEICALADKHGLSLFADQVYKGLELDGQPQPWVCDLYDKAVSLGVLSKSYGLPGLRIGWAAAQDTEVIQRMGKMKNYLSICCTTEAEVLAGVALRHGDTLIKRNLEIVRRNLALWEKFLEQYGVWFENNPPLAGPIAFHQLHTAVPIAQFCEQMADTAGVLLLPGNIYDFTGNYFRMGYGKLPYGENLKKLGAYLDAHQELLKK